jgi:hypothetical protein
MQRRQRAPPEASRCLKRYWSSPASVDTGWLGERERRRATRSFDIASRQKEQRAGRWWVDPTQERPDAWKAIAAARLLLSTNAGARWGPIARRRTLGPRPERRPAGRERFQTSASGRRAEQCPVRGSLSGITVADDVLARRERIAAAGHDRRNARRAAELALRSLRER